jgi:hypothetical protein
MRIIQLIAFMLFIGSFCSPIHAQQANTQSVSKLRDQGLLYHRKKMTALAKEQFDLAYAQPEGAKDYVVVYNRALVAYDLLQLEVAFEMAELAVKLATEEQDKNEAGSLLEKLKGLFSYVEIEPAKQETNKKGRIYLDSKTKILNPEKRELFEKIQLRFREMDVTLPTKIYLPYGKYKANNVPFDIVEDADEVPKVQVFFHIIQDDSQKKMPAWMLGSLGVAGATAVGLATYFLFFNADPEVQYRTNVSIAPLGK